MLLTEMHTAQIPESYKRFAAVVGDSHWKQRVSHLKQEVKGNRLLDRFLRTENAIAFQLEHLRELNAKFGSIPLWETNNHDIYPAASFAAQTLSIMDRSSKENAEQLKRRVHGALKNPDDMRGLRLELSAATHFARRGHKIIWPEMSGQGTFDLLVKDIGPAGLEVECKSISEDKGRKVHRRDALDFYRVLWPYLEGVRKGLQTGLSAVLTVPGRLPTLHRERVSLAKEFGAQIFAGRSTTLNDGCEIRITEFDVARLGDIPSATRPQEVRAAVDETTGTRNREVMVIGTGAGGALALTVQSAANDSLMRSVFDTLSDSAKRQLSGNRAAMFLTGFHGLDGKQLLSVAGQDDDPAQQPTSLRLAVSKFLSARGRDHVIGVGFLSQSGLTPVQDGLVDSGGTAYLFPKRESPYWHDDFSGLFSWSRSAHSSFAQGPAS